MHLMNKALFERFVEVIRHDMSKEEALEYVECLRNITMQGGISYMMNIADVSSINDAMRMRDIRFGGKNAGKMIEYRLIPLLVCSARIGEELNAAAITRGLGGDVKRTNVCQIGFHIQDYVLILMCAVPYLIWILSILK